MRSITMREMMNLKNIDVLDVREYEEVISGMIPGATHIPLGMIPGRVSELNKSKEYYVVCHTGSRSMMVSQFLSQQGYKVVNVMGGMSAYRGALNYEM